MGETSKEQEIKGRRRKRRCQRQEKKEGKMPNTSLIYLLYIPGTELQKSFMYVILGVLGLPRSPQTAGGCGRASSSPQLRKQPGRCIQKAQEALGSCECWLGLERSAAGKRCGFNASFCFPLLVEEGASPENRGSAGRAAKGGERGVTCTRISLRACNVRPGGLKKLGSRARAGGWEMERWHN